MQDLWPEDIGETSDVKAPINILREQAALLGRKTRNLVQAEALSIGTGRMSEFEVAFLLTSKPLGNYRYLLFKIVYSADLYPVTFWLSGDLAREVTPSAPFFPIEQSQKEEPTGITVKTEDEFLRVLKLVLGSRKTRRIINGILAQIEPSPSPAPRSDVDDDGIPY